MTASESVAPLVNSNVAINITNLTCYNQPWHMEQIIVEGLCPS